MSTFKQYYANPEWKERHLAKLRERVTCECGAESSKVNLGRHMHSEIHIKRMDQLYKCKCGVQVKRKDRAKHEASKGHELYVYECRLNRIKQKKKMLNSDTDSSED